MRVMVSCPGQYCGDIDDGAANEAAMYLLCLWIYTHPTTDIYIILRRNGTIIE